MDKATFAGLSLGFGLALEAHPPTHSVPGGSRPALALACVVVAHLPLAGQIRAADSHSASVLACIRASGHVAHALTARHLALELILLRHRGTIGYWFFVSGFGVAFVLVHACCLDGKISLSDILLLLKLIFEIFKNS